MVTGVVVDRPGIIVSRETEHAVLLDDNMETSTVYKAMEFKFNGGLIYVWVPPHMDNGTALLTLLANACDLDPYELKKAIEHRDFGIEPEPEPEEIYTIQDELF